MPVPHTRSRYSGSPVTPSTRAPPLPFPALPEGAARETGGERKKRTRVLAATMNSPLKTGSQHQAQLRPRPAPGNNDAAGGASRHLHASTAPRAAIRKAQLVTQ